MKLEELFKICDAEPTEEIQANKHKSQTSGKRYIAFTVNRFKLTEVIQRKQGYKMFMGQPLTFDGTADHRLFTRFHSIAPLSKYTPLSSLILTDTFKSSSFLDNCIQILQC